MTKCNICGCSAFVDQRQRIAVRCAECGSYERTRLLWMHLEKLDIGKNTRILHLAPEKGVYKRLREVTSPKNYVVADIDPKSYEFAASMSYIDLCQLDDWPSKEFDLIIHSHVLEHIPCNIAYTLFHLHRMLKSRGTHLFCVPFVPGKYDESFQNLSWADRVKRFGQKDHIRRFGTQDISMHFGKLMEIPPKYSVLDCFSEASLRDANIPEQEWYGYNANTILKLRRNDMKFIKGATKLVLPSAIGGIVEVQRKSLSKTWTKIGRARRWIAKSTAREVLARIRKAF